MAIPSNHTIIESALTAKKAVHAGIAKLDKLFCILDLSQTNLKGDWEVNVLYMFLLDSNTGILGIFQVVGNCHSMRNKDGGEDNISNK